MGILNVDLHNFNFDDANFDGDDCENIFHVRFIAWYNRLKQHEALKNIYIDKN